MQRHLTSRSRRGNVLVLTVLMMVGMCGMLALAIDVGYLFVAEAELQRSADAAALSAAWDLIDPDAPAGEADPVAAAAAARASATRYAGLNTVRNDAPALAAEDAVVGRLTSYSADATLDTSTPASANAVRVNIRRTDEQNGEVGLFFARVLGIDSCPLQAQATAAFVSNFRGFRTPSSGGNLGILPFALDEDTWDATVAEQTADDWGWENGQSVCHHDGIFEANLFPQNTGASGNRGTVDIGSSNNSTNDIKRQILEGISPDDLAQIGGELRFNDCGEIYLNGDTGISAAVKSQLETIKGQTRIIPIFRSVTGPGNNAQYTIVKFVGVRIMEVRLTGSMSSKRLIVQPATVVCRGGIPDANPTPRSEYVYSPVWLVR